jgi:streptomycin 6-kinase
VVRSARGWLAIDPKPLLAEREFSLAPVIRSPELGPGRQDLERRLDRLTAAWGLDRRRTLGWAIAQTVAWGASGTQPGRRALPWMLELWERTAA